MALSRKQKKAFLTAVVTAGVYLSLDVYKRQGDDLQDIKRNGISVHYTRSGRFPVGKYGYSGETQRAGREMNVKEMEIPCKKNVLSVKHLLFIWNRMNGWSANYVIKKN